MQKIITYRLIADEGKVLTNGKVKAYVVDIGPNSDNKEWTEIEDENRKEEKLKTEEVETKETEKIGDDNEEE